MKSASIPHSSRAPLTSPMSSTIISTMSSTSQSNPYVVHCKRSPYDVYIGRACLGMPKGEVSVWGNPFVMKNQTELERHRVTEEYRQWIYSQPELIQRIQKELKGKVLGCWCAPKQCHGNILAAIANSDSISAAEPSSATEHSLDTESSSKSCCEESSLSRVEGKLKKKKKSQLQTYQSLIPSSAPAAPAVSPPINNPPPTPTPNPPLQSSTPPSGTLPSTSRQSIKKSPPPLPLPSPALSSSTATTTPYPIFDIGINLTNSQLKSKWKTILQRANAAGVSPILTGTTLENCQQNLLFCRQWNQLLPLPSLLLLYLSHSSISSLLHHWNPSTLRLFSDRHHKTYPSLIDTRASHEEG